MLHIVNSEPKMQIFADAIRKESISVIPKNGISAVQMFENFEEWLQLGCWTNEDILREIIEIEIQRDSNSHEGE